MCKAVLTDNFGSMYHSSVVCIQIAFSCCLNDVFDLITNLTFLMRRDTFFKA